MVTVFSKKSYIQHLKKFSPYNKSKDWVNWYADVAKHKGLRTAQILKEYKNTDARLLDLGCGIGLTLSVLAQEFPNSIGCDVDEEAIRATRLILRKLKLKTTAISYDGVQLPFKDNTFDIITCIEVIEHAKDVNLLLREIARVLKPDGLLHITTANKWWPYEPHFKLLFLAYLPGRLANFYVKVSGKGEDYEGIKLPSYGGFRKIVSKYFIIDDITLKIIRNYQRYEFDKERGRKVILVGKFLQALYKLDKIPLFRYLPITVEWLLVRVSLGWLFIGFPKKTK